ncbi:hypothetical protein SF06_12460 [Pseudomonas flexibilis]|uniref:Uncharacterized protein n=1 Tax=Pseudomonas flexibilis TaxID=706570 RepID=A0A1N6P729_9PSED|nr:hypothetical protein SF06_12460 [Pseudomonas flexibilis]SIQ00077.1 hypothetical protein SAMN05421672_10242 [Pseudomonas flexibilis]
MACRWKKPDLLWIGALLAVIADSLIGAYKFAQSFAYSFTDCGLGKYLYRFVSLQDDVVLQRIAESPHQDDGFSRYLV